MLTILEKKYPFSFGIRQPKRVVALRKVCWCEFNIGPPPIFHRISPANPAGLPPPPRGDPILRD